MENTLIDTLGKIYNRDLQKLRIEIEAYTDNKTIWTVEGSIKNSGGNLCLHLIGNLNTYICAEFAKNGYIRQRELEFSSKGISKSVLLEMIDKTIVDINLSLEKLKDIDLKADYPHLVFDKKTSIEYLLIHLCTHLTYHLGQINYHRRLLNA